MKTEAEQTFWREVLEEMKEDRRRSRALSESFDREAKWMMPLVVVGSLVIAAALPAVSFGLTVMVARALGVWH